MGLALNTNFSAVSYGASGSMKNFQGTMSKSLRKISSGKNYVGGGHNATTNITNAISYKKTAKAAEAAYYTQQKSAGDEALKVAELETALESALNGDSWSASGATGDFTAAGTSGASAIATALNTAYSNLTAADYSSTYYQALAGAAESAYSGVADTDIAMEMSKYVKANVGAQAAQAMVAQANQSMASILNLLQ